VSWVNNFIVWFNGLDASIRVTLIGSGLLLINGLLSAYIARLGVKLSAKTSKQISDAALNAAHRTKVLELQHSGRVKIAEARIDWIEKFRENAAELYGVHSQITRFRDLRRSAKHASEYDAGAMRELLRQSSALRAQLLMRIDPQSQVEAERDLEKLLRTAQPTTSSDASQYRRSFRERTRAVLNAEWKKAKAEIHETTYDMKGKTNVS
jgi:hypothetical protein